MDEGAGVSKSRQKGWAGVRLCNLAAQSAFTAEGSVQAGSGEGLTGRESEPWEIIYFKIYKTQIPVIEQAIETAALMLGTDKSRGYCLEMICADFLAGANLENGDPTVLLQSISRFFKFLPGEQRQAFLQEVNERGL
jgi:hypothetical protein